MSRTDEPGDLEVRERLRALRVEPPDRGFEAALRRRLVEAGPPRPVPAGERLLAWLRRPALLWPAAGVAAGVAAFLALRAVLPVPDGPGGPASAPLGNEARASAVLPSTRVAVVRLNLAADVAVDAAQIRVTLPPGLAFWSGGEELAERTFEWTQPLAAGDNEIPIAVRGSSPGRYRIAVQARVDGGAVEDEVIIDVVGG